MDRFGRCPGVAVAPPAAPPVDVQAVVAEAVSAALSEQDKKNRALLAATERKHMYAENSMAARLADYAENLDKRFTAATRMAMDDSSQIPPMGGRP